MSNKIYVGNLSYTTEEHHLENEFAKFGNVISCKLITDRDTGRSKGFAFVEMESAEDAQEAIEKMNGADVDGRNLRVNEAKPQERRDRGSFQKKPRW
jgi:cold-inducible RNA-binding protein